MTDVSDKVLAAAKKKLIEINEEWDSGVCSGTCLDLDGEEFVTPHTACHSWIGYAYTKVRRSKDERWSTTSWTTTYPKDAKPFLVLSCHSKKHSKSVCSEEAMDAIILWMARESPFSEFVLNRDDDDSLLNGGVILLCGPGALTQAQAMWICKVLRYSTEGAKALDTWLALYKGGVNPLLAVLVCSYVRTIKGATFGFTGVEGHSTVFDAYGGGEPDVASLLEGTINPAATDTASVFRTDVKAKGGKIGKQATPSVVIKGFCKPYQKDDGWGGKIIGEGADGPEFVRRVLEWQHEVEGVTTPPTPPSKDTVFLDLDL
jgi:hypothetical protein